MAVRKGLNAVFTQRHTSSGGVSCDSMATKTAFYFSPTRSVGHLPRSWDLNCILDANTWHSFFLLSVNRFCKHVILSTQGRPLMTFQALDEKPPIMPSLTPLCLGGGVQTKKQVDSVEIKDPFSGLHLM